MPVDTGTRLIPPPAARERIRSLADHPATRPSPHPKRDDEKARALDVPEYRGRHRTTDEVATRPMRLDQAELVKPAESSMPGEGPTRQIPLPQVGQPTPALDQREPGRVLHSAGDAGLLASIQGAAQRLRGYLKAGAK